MLSELLNQFVSDHPNVSWWLAILLVTLVAWGLETFLPTKEHEDYDDEH